jgi:hypothetical protein
MGAGYFNVYFNTMQGEKMKKSMNKKIIAAVALSATLTLPAAVMAQVSGPCGDCHTMHNSQDGLEMTGDTFGTSGGADATSTTPANGSLLRYGCIGCHTGNNDGSNDVPFVFSTGAVYGTDTLAGGNFRWVAAGENAMGHNVVGIASTVDPYPTAPGGTQTEQVTCAGVYGCHGTDVAGEFKSIAGGHHGSGGVEATGSADGNKTYVSGSTTDMSDAYRMLSNIKGIEDNDWEYTNTTANDHNFYYGINRSNDVDTADAPNDGTISSLCAKCHGDFHNGVSGTISDDGTMSSPWVRHPTDFDMSELLTDSEYSGYTSYNVEVPVAMSVMADAAAIMDDNLAKGGTATSGGSGYAIITCISCHRAHGSPNADLLRWDYSTMNAHDATLNASVLDTGCFTCHTTKDE